MNHWKRFWNCCSIYQVWTWHQINKLRSKCLKEIFYNWTFLNRKILICILIKFIWYYFIYCILNTFTYTKQTHIISIFFSISKSFMLSLKMLVWWGTKCNARNKTILTDFRFSSPLSYHFVRYLYPIQYI